MSSRVELEFERFLRGRGIPKGRAITDLLKVAFEHGFEAGKKEAVLEEIRKHVLGYINHAKMELKELERLVQEGKYHDAVQSLATLWSYLRRIDQLLGACEEVRR